MCKLSSSGLYFPAFLFLVTLLLFLACAEKATFPAPIQQASHTYKESGDYRSLEKLTTYIHKGMPVSEVIQLLGEPVYSPIEGQFYYTSDSNDAETGFVLGVVIYYTREDSTHPSSPWILEDYQWMPIGE